MTTLGIEGISQEGNRQRRQEEEEQGLVELVVLVLGTRARNGNTGRMRIRRFPSFTSVATALISGNAAI